MDGVCKLIARKMFRLRVHEAKGTAYQQLLEKVMQYREPTFTPIKPHGNIGDRKNDGYIPATGTYFQVYAPENPDAARTHIAAASKASDDFAGLKEYWDKSTPIQVFRFAYNDAYRGSPPPVEEAMAILRNTHQIDASTFLAKDLEAEAMQLDEDELVDVVHTPIPTSDLLPSIDFSVLREVIHHILGNNASITIASILQAPDFDDKIEFNGLSSGIAHLLNVGSYQSEAITDYFSKNSTYARQQVRDQLADLYTSSRERLNISGIPPEDLGDLVFFDILERITPRIQNTVGDQNSYAQHAAIVVMAYYFEACDIFEGPDAFTG